MMDQQKKNRILILLIFALSIVPMMVAWVLSENTELLAKGINNGRLITPPVTTERSDYEGFDNFSETNKAELPGHWLIVNVIVKSACNELCLDAILKTKQIRLMLNKELSRTRRVAMIFDPLATEAANQLWLKDSLLWRLHRSKNRDDEALYSRLRHQDQLLDESLITRLIATDNRQFALSSDLIRIKPSTVLVKKLIRITDGKLTDGMMFLIDPLGNLMMRYDPGFDPYKVKNDLMHLLKISQIG